MVFSSFSFVFLFLPAVVLAHLAVMRSPQARTALLLGASLLFYALGSWQTLPVLAISFVLNAWCCRAVTGDGPHRLRWLWTGIGLNVLLLGAFKYTTFAASNLEAVTGIVVPIPELVLPLGISFFTLQQIRYLVDCYEGLAEPAPLLRHALVLSFFPVISAGPIVRVPQVLDQLAEPEPQPRFDAGVARFVIGLTKKVMISDLCGLLVDQIFGSQLPIGVIEGWIGGLGYVAQLYFDFSGYCDMAIGIGWMLGIRLPENFDAPMRSTSVVEFWRRWHITLSQFITTYMYTPAVRAMAPITFAKAMVVTVVVMTIAGLWHGPAWTFVVFGIAHGLAMVVNHLWKKRKIKLPRPVSMAMTFVFLTCTFVLFRAASLSEAATVIAGMFGFGGLGSLRGGPLAALTAPDLLISLGALGVGMVVLAVAPPTGRIFDERKPPRFGFRPAPAWVAVSAALLVWSLILMNATATKGFIYRDF